VNSDRVILRRSFNSFESFEGSTDLSMAAFRYSLSVLKIYSARYVYYRFSVLAVNIETQPMLYVKCKMIREEAIHLVQL